MKAATSTRVLPIIIFSQFCCTSLWFAGNSIIEDLILFFQLSPESLGYISSSVQFGFIIGTFIFAIFTLSDRYSPSRIFFICAVIAALCNLGILYQNNTMTTLLVFRFLTGFSLAGIYPIGMKIAADHFEKGLGKSLSFLIAALVLGTAFPYLITSFNLNLKWEMVIWVTSSLAVLGGILILMFVPDGPYQKLAQKFEISKILQVFKDKAFKSAAFGYFGHMWELYAFWTFVPVLLITHAQFHTAELNIPLFSFIIIASGAVSCVIGGFISSKLGIKKTAILSLSISGICCLLSPVFFMISSSFVFIVFLIIWGMAVIADSPLFSTMVAQNCDSNAKGTALTIVNCIGFSITIISIQLLNALITYQNYIQFAFMVLAIGPILGLIALKKR
ncbi:MFS transporter [Winogradskyella eckloniae]|uniref:MFS transporter n=1 Tax=Winogradskyella eckloniae TaxID=1089306 RepID=UPI00156454B4|nr:MFS transporter [Winogradskyella eckloniae]NRD20636.1 MFS transporter [Winogradskyella eckloniae]